MAADTISDILADLQKFYGKTLTQAQAGFYRSEMAELNEGDLCNAILACKRSEPPQFFPSMITIRKHYEVAQQQRFDREKEKAPIFADLKKNADTTAHGRQAIRLMIDLYEKKRNRQQYLAGMREMDKKFPSFGWAQAATELEQWWATEEKRHEVGKKYLERIWRMQDANGLKSFNNPDWYLKRLKEQP